MHSPCSPSLSLKDRLLLVKGIGAKTAQELVNSPGRPEDVARILKARGINHSARPQAFKLFAENGEKLPAAEAMIDGAAGRDTTVGAPRAYGAPFVSSRYANCAPYCCGCDDPDVYTVHRESSKETSIANRCKNCGHSDYMRMYSVCADEDSDNDDAADDAIGPDQESVSVLRSTMKSVMGMLRQLRF